MQLMKIEPIHVLIAIAVGLGATLVMDLWAIFLKRAFNVPSPNYCFVGRWLRYMPEGIFRHSRIAAAPQKSSECTVGWIAHYAIGVIFALSLVLLASPQWLQELHTSAGDGPWPRHRQQSLFSSCSLRSGSASRLRRRPTLPKTGCEAS